VHFRASIATGYAQARNYEKVMSLFDNIKITVILSWNLWNSWLGFLATDSTD